MGYNNPGCKKNDSFRTVFKHAPVGMFILDEQGLVGEANSAGLGMLYLKTADIYGKNFGDALCCKGSFEHAKGCGYGKDCRSCRIVNGIKGALNEGIIISDLELKRFFIRDNREQALWLKISIAPIDNNGVLNVIVTLVDISARKHKEEDAIKARDHYIGMFENFPTLIWRAGENKQCHYLNKYWSQFTGKPISKGKGHGWLEFIHPDDREQCANAVRYAPNERAGSDLEIRMRHWTGEYRWILSINRPFFDVDGNYGGIIGMGFDITETKKAQLEVEQSQKKYQSLFMNVSSGIIYGKIIMNDQNIPSDFEFIEINQTLEKLIGIPRENILGRTFGELFPAYLGSYAERICWYASAGGEDRISGDWYSPINNAWYSISVYSPAPGAFLAIMTDISAQKTAEIQMKKAKEAAEAANRSKSNFLANMSHEIRTPINGMVGMIDLTLLTELTDEQRENLDTAKACATSLLNIINDILDFSKLEVGKLNIEKVEFNIKEVVEEVTKAHSVKALSKGLDFYYTLSPAIPNVVTGDPNRLRQVLNNLIDNSIKFTEMGGVSLTVRQVTHNEHEVTISFIISDSGIGIDDKDITKLFKTFSQVDGSITRRFGGTGLGLAISKQLVELMGGRIAVQSQVGVGSTFTFLLSYPIGNEKPVRSRSKQPFFKTANPRSILLVEDNPVNKDATSKLLNKMGHRVVAVSGGLQALEILKKQAFDVILLDIQMSGMDGVEVTKNIRAEEKGTGRYTPIIAVTAHAVAGDREKYLALGMDEYVTKPINIEELYQKIEQSDYYLPEKLSGKDDITINEHGELQIVSNKISDCDCFAEMAAISPLLSEIEIALEQKDLDAIEAAAHKIKTMASAVNAVDLKDAAFKVELAARRESLTDAAKYHLKLQQIYQAMVKSGNIEEVY